MSNLKVLICGAGIAGNALGFWLSKLGHAVTVIERAPELRDTGLQVDLRGPGIQVLRRMGLEEAFRTRVIPEQGLQLVDRKGVKWGYFPANRSGKGLQSFTTDFEVMRGDLCRLLYEACEKMRVTYRFGMCVKEISQGTEEHAEVSFQDGTRERFDLVVGADGACSHTRKIILEAGSAAEYPFYALGVCAGYFTIEQPVQAGEGYNATAFLAPGNKGIMTRRADPDKYQAYIFCKTSSSERLQKTEGKGSSTTSQDEKEGFVEVFRGAGWRTDEILKGLAAADDFYCERMGVVKMDHWSRGRVVLLGDAAYCPTAMTGMGTSCAMAGAYVLAGEIGTWCREDSSMDSIKAALGKYEEKLRPFIQTVQSGIDEGYMDKFPSSRLGIHSVYVLFWVASFLKLDVLAKWILREDTGGWELPEYRGMDVLDSA